MPYQLLVTHGRSATQTLRLAEGVTTVGRHEECQLRIRSSQVSRKHCQLFEKKGLLIVKDLGSSNGTFVNGKKIEEQRVLEPGDELTIGPVRLKVAKPEAPAAAAAGAAAPGGKATDTAVAEAIPVGEDEVFEIELDDQEPTVAAMPTAPAPKPEAPPKPAEKDEPIELGEDAVAGFLLDLDIDEDDKK